MMLPQQVKLSRAATASHAWSRPGLVLLVSSFLLIFYRNQNSIETISSNEASWRKSPTHPQTAGDSSLLTLNVSSLADPIAAAQSAFNSTEPEPSTTQNFTKITSTSAFMPVVDKNVYHKSPSIPGYRSQRFPSVAERVKLYMSNWFVPPCEGSPRIQYHYMSANASLNTSFSVDRDILLVENTEIANAAYQVGRLVRQDSLIHLTVGDIQSCSDSPPSRNMAEYCTDLNNSLLPALEALSNRSKGSIEEAPFLLQFGDRHDALLHGHVQVPFLKKFRKRIDSDALSSMTEPSCISNVQQRTLSHQAPLLESILWKLETGRHYGHVGRIKRLDTPWREKRNVAVFRGTMTGFVDGFDRNHDNHLEKCLLLPRCRLVHAHANSSLVDAKLTNTFGRLPDTIEGVTLVSERLTKEEILQYKAIVILEGNDVSSGLKWALYSSSVVIMPRPTVTSWAMEELLEPWIHYIPCSKDLTDIEERMQWIIDNDLRARQLVVRSRLWISDLLLHPNATSDDQQINEEIIRRYRAHFVPIQ
jgi:hypothetical protein